MTDHPAPQPPLRQRPWLWVALLIGTAALLAVGVLTQRAPAKTPSDPQAVAPRPQVGYRAPDFTLRDVTGAPVHLGDLRGHSIVLNFWYADCSGCQIEAPFVERIYADHEQQGLIVLGVDIADNAATATHYAARFGVTYPLVMDSDHHAQDLYQVHAAPVSFFIDQQGVIRAIVAGALDQANSAAGIRLIGGG